jgi:hypothetical protein
MKDKSNSLELFYSDSSHLLIDDWANIVHSIVTYADKIWLNEECCFFKKAFQHNDDFRGLSSTIADLRDAGIIKTWQFEDYLQSSDGSITRIIGNNEHRMLHEEISQSIIDMSKRIGSDNASRYNTQSKFVDARNQLLHLGLASLCDADGLVYNRNRIRPNEISSQLLDYENVYKKYTNQLFKEFSIGDLSKLSSSDIIELRSLSKYFRDRVNSFVKAKVLPLQGLDSKILEDCQNLYGEYECHLQELVREKQGKHTVIEIIKDTLINSVGIFIPAASFVPSVEKVVNWAKDRNQRGFLAYMLQVKKVTKDREFNNLQN